MWTWTEKTTTDARTQKVPGSGMIHDVVQAYKKIRERKAPRAEGAHSVHLLQLATLGSVARRIPWLAT